MEISRIDELCIRYVAVRAKQALGDASQETDSARSAIHTKIYLDWDGANGSRHEVGNMALERGFHLIKKITTTSSRGGAVR